MRTVYLCVPKELVFETKLMLLRMRNMKVLSDFSKLLKDRITRDKADLKQLFSAFWEV